MRLPTFIHVSAKTSTPEASKAMDHNRLQASTSITSYDGKISLRPLDLGTGTVILGDAIVTHRVFFFSLFYTRSFLSIGRHSFNIGPQLGNFYS